MRPWILLAAGLLLPTALPAAPAPETAPATRPPLDFRVLKSDAPATGEWEFSDPITGVRTILVLKESGRADKALAGVLADGTEILTLLPRAGGVGYTGSLTGLLRSCGQDRLTVTDFLPLGERASIRFEAKPAEGPCSFLENPATSRWFIAPVSAPVKLLAAGEITSDRVREQIGLGAQPGGPSTPITAGAILVDGGTEVRYRSRTRSLDGSTWIEVETMVSPAVGIEPPRGFIPSEGLRVAGSISMTRRAPAPASPSP